VATAINLYLTTVSAADLDGAGGTFICGTNFGASVALASTSFSGLTNAQSGNFSINGNGWVPVDFTAMTSAGGSPISTLPRDPTNTTGTGIAGTGLYYDYACNNGSKWYELDAGMESTRYSTGGADDRESTDGGSSTSFYEIGNDPGLDL
jgi:hypothetical protein